MLASEEIALPTVIGFSYLSGSVGSLSKKRPRNLFIVPLLSPVDSISDKVSNPNNLFTG